MQNRSALRHLDPTECVTAFNEPFQVKRHFLHMKSTASMPASRKTYSTHLEENVMFLPAQLWVFPLQLPDAGQQAIRLLDGFLQLLSIPHPCLWMNLSSAERAFLQSACRLEPLLLLGPFGPIQNKPDFFHWYVSTTITLPDQTHTHRERLLQGLCFNVLSFR